MGSGRIDKTIAVARRWLGALWRARRWLALAAIVALVAARLALPSILRRVIASQASQALRARVEVGGVELSLWHGRVGLRDVAVFAATAAGEPALVGWKQLEVEVAYAPLFHKLVRLREVVLDTPRVALDRLADGQLNLRQLVAREAPEAPATSPPAPVSGGGWGFALDRFVLRGGGIRFRDLFVPQSEPLEAEIPAVEVVDVSFQPGLYDQPAHVVLDVQSEGSRVRTTANIRLLERGVSVEADLEAKSLPLRRGRLYVPGVGWSELAGLADASLRYRLETERKNELRGSITIRDLEVKTPKLDQPALAWERLAIHLEPVDLLARAAVVSLVELKGASVVASLRGGEILPLVAGGKADGAAAAPATESPVAKAEPPPPNPWHWSVKRVRVEGSKLVVDRPGAVLPIGVTLSASDLAPDPSAIATMDLGLAVGAGRIDATGRLRLSPPAFGGTLRASGLDLRELIPAVPTLPQDLVKTAVVGGELTVEAGVSTSGEPASPDAIRLKGRLQVEKLRVSASDPKAFSAGWKRFEVKLDDVLVPGVLAPPAAPARAPIRVAVGSVRLEEPWANLTRTPQGIVLPEVAKRPSEEKAAAKPATIPAQAQASPPAPDVRVASLIVRAGRVAVVDRSVTPFFSGEVKPIELEARTIVSKGPAVESFRFSATGFQQGKVEIKGTLRANGDGSVEIDGSRVGLTPFNPYVASASSYSLGKGSLSVSSKVTFTRDHYDTQSQVTVHELSLQGAEGDTLFRQNFGIPLSTALALLTDLHGDIHLDVPVTVDKGATKVDLVAVVASALKAAVLGAVLSPLKILGAVAGLGAGSAAIAPQPIPSLVGRADPTSEGMERIGQLAELLGGRPGIGVDFAGLVGDADVRWLREQKLRAKLEAGPGVVAAVTGLPTRNARKRILQALVDRAKDEPGDLSAEDAALLEKWLKDVPELSADEIRGLARERAKRAAALLRDDHGIDEKRLRAAEPESAEATASQPGVTVTIGLPAS